MSKNSSRHLVSFLSRCTVSHIDRSVCLSPALLQKTSLGNNRISKLYHRFNYGSQNEQEKRQRHFDNLLSYFQSSNVTKIKEMQTKYLRVVEQEQFKSGAFSPAGLVRDNFAEICLVERPDDAIFERLAGEKMKVAFHVFR